MRTKALNRVSDEPFVDEYHSAYNTFNRKVKDLLKSRNEKKKGL